MPDKDALVKLFIKQVSGEPLSDQERERLERWIAKSPRNKRTSLDCCGEEAITKMLQVSHKIDQDSSWNAIKQLLSAPSERRYRSSSLLLWPILGACVLLALIGGNHLFFARSMPMIKDFTGYLLNAPHSPAAGKALFCFENGISVSVDSLSFTPTGTGFKISNDPSGEIEIQSTRDHIQPAFVRLISGKDRGVVCKLPDGSRVFLHPSSTLRVGSDFLDGDRTIQISGKAYLDIQPYRHPFLVVIETLSGENVSSPLIVRDKGSLAISAELQDELVKGMVLSGTAHFQTVGKGDFSISQGQQLSFNKLTHIQSINSIDSFSVAGHPTDEFNFSQISMKTALEQIAHWYGIKMLGAEVVGNTQVIANFRKDQSLESILSVLEVGGQFRAILEGDHYAIVPISQSNPKKIEL